MTRALLASAMVIGLGATVAQAATVDFTDDSVWASGSSTFVVDGVTVSLSSTGGAIQQTAFDAPADTGGLFNGSTDGLGIGDDEISFGDQSITVSFSAPVKITGLRFLDLFLGPLGQDFEVAIATFSGGDVVNTSAFAAGPGNGFVSNESFSPIVASSVTFTAGIGNDGAGSPDFALAGLSFENVSIVPLPATVLLMGAGLISLAAAGRRRA